MADVYLTGVAKLFQLVRHGKDLPSGTNEELINELLRVSILVIDQVKKFRERENEFYGPIRRVQHMNPPKKGSSSLDSEKIKSLANKNRLW